MLATLREMTSATAILTSKLDEPRSLRTSGFLGRGGKTQQSCYSVAARLTSKLDVSRSLRTLGFGSLRERPIKKTNLKAGFFNWYPGREDVRSALYSVAVRLTSKLDVSHSLRTLRVRVASDL